MSDIASKIKIENIPKPSDVKNKEEFTHVLSPNGLCLKKIEYKEKFLQKIITHSVNR